MYNKRNKKLKNTSELAGIEFERDSHDVWLPECGGRDKQ